MKKFVLSIFVLVVSLSFAGPESIVFTDEQKKSSNDFVLAGDNSAADVLVDKNDTNTVLLAARLFSEDVERVTGIKAQVKTSVKKTSPNYIIVGTIEKSIFISTTVYDGKIDVSEVKGKWESLVTQVVDNPFGKNKKALVIAGSDRRGAAYGLLEISKQMGVSPWYYFADVAVKKSDSVFVKSGRYVQKSP